MFLGKKTFAGAGKVVGGAVAGAGVVPQATIGALNLVGFTSLGPAAGSMAAAIQSSIGCVAVGSPFAIAQSIAMGGLAGPLAVAGAGVGVVVVLAATARGGNKPSDDELNPDEPNPDDDERDDKDDGHGGEGERSE